MPQAGRCWTLTHANCTMQLREFYGPLLACVTATKSAYNAMVKTHSPDGTSVGFHKAMVTDPDGPTAAAYRWVTHCST